MRGLTLPAALLLGAALVASCGGARPATEADCGALLDRLVELELAERGFHDPALLSRRQAEARTRFAPDLEACRGRRLPAAALDCATRAATAEAVAHGCLR
jgi:hypothetical protein